MFDPQKFKHIREEKHLNQSQVARLAGVSRQAVQQWERGSTKPRLEILIKLSAELEADLQDFF